MNFDKYLHGTKWILIIVSDPLDYDCIGSGLILKRYLESQGKDVVVRHPLVPAAEEKEVFEFLPGFDEIEYGDTREAFAGDEFDALIFVDGSGLMQFYDASLDALEPDISRFAKRVHVDHHHQPETRLGALLIHDEKVSSTVELILREIFPKDLIDKDIATLAYAALMGDTGHFRYNVFPETLRLAAKLLEKGANSDLIMSKMSFSKSERHQELLIWALERVEYNKEVQTAFLTVSKEEMKKYNFLSNDLELMKQSFSDEMGRVVEGYHRGFLLREEENNMVHVNARGDAGTNNIDLPVMLRELGGSGGGHSNSCGFDLKGNLEEVKEQIIQAICQNSQK